MAPELLNADGAELDAGKASFSSDMYAVAMVFWEVRFLLLYLIKAQRVT